MRERDKPSFSVRPAIKNDVLAIISVHRAAALSAISFYDQDTIDGWSPEHPTQERLRGLTMRIENGEEVAVVAETQEGKVIGFGSIVPAKSLLGALYVDPSHGHQGVGTEILTRLETLAQNAGLTELNMDSSLNAEAFYSSHGYKTIKQAEHILMSGRRMVCVQMTKSL